MVAFDEKALNALIMSKIRQSPKGQVDTLLRKLKEIVPPKKVIRDKRL